MRSYLVNQSGLSLIATVLALMIFSLFLAVAVSLVTTGSNIAVQEEQGVQTFYIAEGGLEFAQHYLFLDANWYRSAADPIQIAATNLGAGSFTVNIFLPATMLSRKLKDTELATINVYTTVRFPVSGLLQIGDDAGLGNGEFVRYTGTTPTTFTGLTRGVTFVGGTLGQAATTYSRGTRVYPVATLITPNPLPGNCNSVTITITANDKFLSAGTINVYNRASLDIEEITYTSSSTAGGIMTLTGVQRCQNGTPAATVNAGDPVTPINVDDPPTSPDFETEIVSTGTVGSNPISGNINRVTRKIVTR